MAPQAPQIHDAIGRYRQFADRRPSANDLQNMIASVESSGEPGTLCTLASMCIDLAFAEPAQRNEALTMARDALGDAVSAVSWYATQQESERTLRRISEPAVTAQLMLAELDNWELAAAGRPVGNGYETLLGHMVIASLHSSTDSAKARLAEAVPLLLGLRRKTQSDGERGWHGRLSLPREDWRSAGSNAPGQNKSWDVGAATSDEVPSFLQPDVRIQVKLGTVYHATRYIRAGIVPLSARLYGFGDPGLVALSCAQENEGYALPHMLSSSELDAITAKITSAPGMNQRLAA
jgi:hypothetical protein